MAHSGNNSLAGDVQTSGAPTPPPADTEQAQYSPPFPVAVALLRGKLGPSDMDGAPLRDPAVLDMARRITLIEDKALSARFPAERYARAMIRLHDGRVVDSGASEADQRPKVFRAAVVPASSLSPVLSHRCSLSVSMDAAGAVGAAAALTWIVAAADRRIFVFGPA